PRRPRSARARGPRGARARGVPRRPAAPPPPRPCGAPRVTALLPPPALARPVPRPKNPAMPLEDPRRTSPDVFLKLIEKSRRGKLKIYIGHAAGVGKTYQVLEDAHLLKKQGVDVVVGFVETHGRAETQAKIADVEVVPRRVITYKGRSLGEMALPAILARKPEVVLVDELAHTNVPGAENEKRYQDVEDILTAGISVMTTVNIQHF